jgi:hypothetical protein
LASEPTAPKIARTLAIDSIDSKTRDLASTAKAARGVADEKLDAVPTQLSEVGGETDNLSRSSGEDRRSGLPLE